MEDIDIKKVIIFIGIILILIIGIFFALSRGDKSYTLEEIKEEDYKYFAIYSNR